MIETNYANNLPNNISINSPASFCVIFILQELAGRTERGARKLMKRGENDSISIWRLVPDMQI